jgi:hypothetical protein
VSQQINLFNPALRPKNELLTAGTMAKAALLFVVVLGAYGSHLNQQTSKLKQQRDELLKQAQTGQGTMVQVARQFPARQPSKALQDEIVATEDKLHEREKVFAVLKSGSIGKNGGFSGLMQAFARQNVNGLWLIGFSANGAGDQMRINGRALAPDMIPEYLGKLSAEQSLRGREFTGLQVTQPKQEPTSTAPSTGQQRPVPAAMPSYIEFALFAEKAADTQPAKTTNSSITGAKS